MRVSETLGCAPQEDKRALGHRQITTTEVYARVSDETLRRVVAPADGHSSFLDLRSRPCRSSPCDLSRYSHPPEVRARIRGGTVEHCPRLFLD